MYRRIIGTWIVFSALAASITTLVSAVMHLEILNQPLDKKVEEDKRTKLSCRVSHLSNDFVVEWYKNEQVITSGRNTTGTRIDRERFFVVGDPSKGHYNLRIQKAKRNDTGNYTCRVYRTLERIVMAKSRTAEVQVVYYPDPYKFPVCIDRPQSERKIREYEMVPVCFSPVGVPPIRLDLVDDSGKVYQDGVYVDYSHRPSFVYVFVNITRKLDGIYCRARSPYFNKYEVKCLLKPIEVLKKPLVHIEALQSSVKLADDIRYLCQAETDSPVLEYIWKIYPNMEQGRVSFFDNKRGIKLSSITANDESTFISCSVRTEAGLTSATTKLKIAKPETTLSPTMTTTMPEIKGASKTSITKKIQIEQQTKTMNINTEHRTLLTEKNLSALPILKNAEGSNIILALSALIIFQFMVILLACVFFRTRTKTNIKLPNETEFPVTGSNAVNPV